MREFSDELNGILDTISLIWRLLSQVRCSIIDYKLLRRCRARCDQNLRSTAGPWTQLKNVGVPDLASWLDLQLSFVETEPEQHTFPKARQSEKQKICRPRVYTTMPPCESDEAVVAHTSISCRVCNWKPWSNNCKKFPELLEENRFELVTPSSACFGCLGTGHVSRQCKLRSKCEKDGCKYHHHSLPHGAPRMVSNKVAAEGC